MNSNIYNKVFQRTSAIKMKKKKKKKKKIEVLTNKPVYLGLLILGLSNILMYQFCYDYLK